MDRADNNLAFILKYENIAWYESGTVKILDRRIYPQSKKFVICKNHREVAQAIANMVTQSAGPYTAAGMGMALAAYEARELPDDKFLEYIKDAGNTIAHARPTTTARMKAIVDKSIQIGIQARQNSKNVEEAIFNHTIETLNKRYLKIENMSKYLLNMCPKETNLMTYCFAETIIGQLLKLAQKNNYTLKVFCPETRPYLQGSKLTASIVKDMGFDVTVITDGMVAYTMKTQNINIFTTAADAICMDGSIINKVGTFNTAIVSKYFGVPYFVTGAPDKAHKEARLQDIEIRNPKEVLEFMGQKVTMEGVKALYPAFDITPPHLISGIVTDIGVFSPYDLQQYYIDSGEGEY